MGPVEFSSPNYPNDYPNSAYEELLINIPSSATLAINILAFSLESSSTEIFGCKLMKHAKNDYQVLFLSS